jgi:hypothetical protein
MRGQRHAEQRSGERRCCRQDTTRRRTAGVHAAPVYFLDGDCLCCQCLIITAVGATAVRRAA